MGLMRRVLDRLHPPGSAWRIIGSLALLMDGIADSLATVRVFLRAAQAESLPLTATDMLEEWHAALGQAYDPTQTHEFQRRMLDAIWTAFGGVQLNQLNQQMHKELEDVDISEIIETGTSAMCGPDPSMIDRGDCESATPPMVRGETVPVTFNATWAREIAAWAHGGAASYKFTKTVAAGTVARVDLNDTILSTDMHGFLPGQTVTMRCWIYISSASGILGSEVLIRISDYQGAFETTAVYAQNIYDAWQEVTVTRTLRAACTGVLLRIQADATAALNEYFNVDEIRIDDADLLAAQHNECGLAECGSTLEGSEVNPFIYSVSGTVENDDEAARVASVIQHFAPLHLTPLSSLTILTDTGSAECGLGVVGITECGSLG